MYGRLIFFVCCWLPAVCAAQLETSHWFLPSNASVNFSTGTPQQVILPPDLVLNGCTSHCDSAGQLQYVVNTYPFKVLDKTLNPMPGPTPASLLSVGYQVYTIKEPGNANRYLMFYCSRMRAEIFQLNYVVIDLSLNGGLGAVVSVDNVADTGISFGFALVQKQNTDEFWIVTHRTGTNSILSWRYDAFGIDRIPLVSTAQRNPLSRNYSFTDIKVSPDGKTLAASTYAEFPPFDSVSTQYRSYTEVYQFNSNIGFASASVKTKTDGTDFYSYAEFSPDSKLLYVFENILADSVNGCIIFNSVIRQYNLCYTDTVQFNRYSTQLYNWKGTCLATQLWGNLQLATNKKIYSRTFNQYLSAINFPNRIGTSSRFEGNQFQFDTINNNRLNAFHLPNFYHQYLAKAVRSNIVYNAGCYPAFTQFGISNDTISNVSWQFGDTLSGVANEAEGATAGHAYTAPGIYLVKAIIKNQLNQPLDTLYDSIEVKDPARRLLYQYPTDTSICEGASLLVKLSVINGIFEWSRRLQDGTGEIIGISDSLLLTGGHYQVRMIQNGCDGCEMTDSIFVGVLPAPVVNLGADRNICNSDGVLLGVKDTANNINCLWSNGQTTDSIFATMPGTYWVQALTSQGCLATDTVELALGNNFRVNLPADTSLCPQQSLLLNPAIASATYIWQDGSTASSYTVSQPGLYWVRASRAGCEATDSLLVSALPSPVFSLGNDTVLCNGNSIVLQAPTTGIAQYLWQDGSSLASFTTSLPGSYRVVITNFNNCTNTDTIVITASNTPEFSLGADTSFCSGTPITLSTGTQGLGYSWNNGSSTPAIIVSQAGSYHVGVSQNGCVGRDTIVVTAIDAPVVNLGVDTTLCTGNSLLLNAAIPGTSYLWSNGSTAPTITVSQGGTYAVAVRLLQCTATDTIVIAYTDTPKFGLGNDVSICAGAQLQLQPTPPLSDGNLLWQDGSTKPNYLVTQPGSYWLQVSNRCGTTTDSIVVAVQNCRRYIPQAFTPNGDGLNDEFRIILNEPLRSYRLVVYNRYGQPVFSASNINTGWDGRYKGARQPVGNYTYTLQYQSAITGQRVQTQGNILLLQ
jgi:gliding motility-associated-like protein